MMLQLSQVASYELKSDPDSYQGQYDESGLRDKLGIYEWRRPHFQSYNGFFFRDCLHGDGCYLWQNGIAYEGHFFANKKEGYGLNSFPDGGTHEGLHKNNIRYGPGVSTYADGRQDIGMWYGNKLIRLCREIEGVPKLATTVAAKELMKCFKRIVEVTEPLTDVAKDILADIGASYSLLERSGNLYASEVMDDRSVVFDYISFLVNIFGEEIFHDKPRKLFAWHSSDLMVDILKHTYKCRMYEHLLTQCVVCLINNERTFYNEEGTKETASFEMLLACKEGRTQDVKDIFKLHGLYPDVTDSRGNSGVMYACTIDNHAIVNYLLDEGGDVNWANDEGLTPISLCMLRYVDLAMDVKNWEKLIPRNLEPASSAEEWFGYVGKHGHQKCSIIEKRKRKSSKRGKLPPCIFDNLDEPPLPKKMATRKKTADIEQAQGGTRERRMERKQTIMKQMAAIVETIKLLIRRGAIPDKCQIPRSSLILAIYCRAVDLVKILLDAGTNPNVRSDGTSKYFTPLALACKMEGHDMVQITSLLLQHGADPNGRCGLEHEKTRRDIILSSRLEETIGDDAGLTPLHILAMKPFYDQWDEAIMRNMAELLLQYGANVNIFYLGLTPLVLAIIMRNLVMVQFLLENNADPNIWLGNELGVPLSVLISERNKYASSSLEVSLEVMHSLLEYGADPLIRIVMDDGEIGTIVDFIHQKYKEQPKKSRTGKLGEEGKLVLNKLQDVIRERVIRHVQGNRAKMLLEIVRDNVVESKVKDINVAKQWLRETDLERCIHFLEKKKIEISPKESERMLILVQRPESTASVSEHSKRTRLSQIAEAAGKRLSEISQLLEQRRMVEIIPEIDEDHDRYIVCFECGKRLPELRLCPMCELVYFCSTACENANAKRPTPHDCFRLLAEKARTEESEPKRKTKAKKKIDKTKGKKDGEHGDFENELLLGLLKSPYVRYRDGDLYNILQLLKYVDENYSYN